MHKGESTATTDHGTIRGWAEKRGGKPAAVAETHRGDDPGLLRIAFQEESTHDGLETISWDEFFEKFEDKRLAFLYQDATKDGGTSRFFKFVPRDQVRDQLQ